MNRFGKNFFWIVAGNLIAIFLMVKYVVPMISRKITSLPFPLPVPGTLMLFYMVLAILALYLYVTFSDEGLAAFSRPINALLRGDHGNRTRSVILGIVPCLVGWQIYEATVPKVVSPVALRIQHPSSNFPKKLETLANPLENPSEAEINAFIDQVKANEVSYIPQVQGDVDAWLNKEKEKREDVHAMAFFPTEPVKRLLEQLKSGNIDKETARAALREKNLFEGRALYSMNCRPCHGDSVGGDGPMADGFKLRPINFTDNGTLETIVEGYTFWRVANGGPGLPKEATPWDSAMPEWKLNLTEEERWKIIMAEYFLAEKTARMPESHGGEEKK